MRMEVLAGPLGDDVSVGSTVPVGVDLFGEGGEDTLTGGPGDDFVEPGAGLDVPKGGAGRDRISFDDGRPGEVTFNLGPDGAATSIDGGEDDEGFEDVTGTPFDDVIVGDAGPNDFDGLDGLDQLKGLDGPDVLDGGAGSDTLRGGVGGDSVTGGPGDDTVVYDEPTRAAVAVTLTAGATTGGDGDLLVDQIENATGGPGDDVIVGNDAGNVLDGGSGKDDVNGAGGSDVVMGGTEDDVVAGGAGTDTMLLGSGDDSFDALEGESDFVDCASGSDTGFLDPADIGLDCERVAFSRPATTPPPAPPPATTTTAPTPAPTIVPAASRLALIGSGISSRFAVSRRFSRLLRLTVLRVPAQGKVVVTCRAAKKDRRKRGRAAPCPFRSRTTNAPRFRARVEFASLFKRRRLTPGTVITITVTAPATIGKVVTRTMRTRKQPRNVLRCVTPGRKPGRC
jgi:hypothetical protein